MVLEYDKDFVDIMIDCDANPMIKDNNGRTPLHEIVHSENKESIDILLSLINKYPGIKIGNF